MRWGLGVVLAVMLFGGGRCEAQEIALDSFSGVGAKAMGMGGAYVSLSNDFSGLFWNPAGLARVQRGEVHWEAVHGRFKNESQFYATPATYELTGTRVSAIGAVVPIPVYRGSLVIGGGFGRNRTFDSGLRISGYDDAAQFDKSGFSEDRGALGAWTLGGAVDLAPNLSVGLALYRWRGTDRFAQELTLDDTRDAHPDTVQLYQQFGSTDHYSAWGVRGGMLYWFPSGLRFGLTMAAMRPLRVSLDANDTFKDVFDDHTDTYPRETYQDVYTIRPPFTFGAGAGWTHRGWTVAGDVHYGNLQEASYDETPQTAAPNVSDFQRQYRNAVRVHLGAEYALAQRGFAVRAGYYRDPIRYVGGGAVPDIQITSDRDAWTVGVGAELARTVVLDIAGVFGGYRLTEGHREDHVRTMRLLASMRFRFDVEGATGP